MMQMLTKAEHKVMEVFWENHNPLAIKDLPEKDSAINPNTAAVAVKNLLNKNFIKVSGITYHGTVLTREFEPIITREEYSLIKLQSDKLSIFDVISAFLKQKPDEKELQKIEDLLNQYKRMYLSIPD